MNRPEIVGNVMHGRVAVMPYPQVLNDVDKYGGWGAMKWQSLLKLKNEDPIKWGSAWHIDLLGQVTNGGASHAPPFSLYYPTLARVAYGSGGAQSTFECDADNASFTVSAELVEVSVSLAQLTQMPTNAVSPYLDYPKEYQVTGQGRLTGQASNQACRLTRTFFLNGLTAPNGTFDYTIPIPPKASSWCFIPVQPVATGDEPLASVDIQSLNFTNEVITAEVAASMSRMHAFRKLPPFADALSPVINEGWSGRLVFHLEV